jgi:hypothetical protein
MARFPAFFVKQVGKAPVAAMDPPGSTLRGAADSDDRQ